MTRQYVLPLGSYQTNCYIVWEESSPTCAVIDPGDQPERVLAQAERLGKTVEAILLTHGHFDHVGAVRAIVQETECKVYLCDLELQLPTAFTAGPLYYTHTYQEGDLVSAAGLHFKVLHTPGHTPGSVCLAVDDRLFSGDTLFHTSCGRTDLPGGDWDQIRQSLQRLRNLPEQLLVYPGHGAATSIQEEKQWNPYMR